MAILLCIYIFFLCVCIDLLNNNAARFAERVIYSAQKSVVAVSRKPQETVKRQQQQKHVYERFRSILDRVECENTETRSGKTRQKINRKIGLEKSWHVTVS